MGGGCFCGCPHIRALVLGVYIKALDFWKLPRLCKVWCDVCGRLLMGLMHEAVQLLTRSNLRLYPDQKHPKSRTPNSRQYSIVWYSMVYIKIKVYSGIPGVDYRTVRWINFLDSSRGLGNRSSLNKGCPPPPCLPIPCIVVKGT